jgi:hypothetical protein
VPELDRTAIAPGYFYSFGGKNALSDSFVDGCSFSFIKTPYRSYDHGIFIWMAQSVLRQRAPRIITLFIEDRRRGVMGVQSCERH